METLISNLLVQLQDLHPQLVDPSDLADTQAEAEASLAETEEALANAKTELQSTRDKNVQSQIKSTKAYEEQVFTLSKELEDLTSRTDVLQDELNGINSEISVARQLSEQLAASIVSLQKSV